MINSNESSYQGKINNLAEWCTENNLLFNVCKTKELIVDFMKQEAKTHSTSVELRWSRSTVLGSWESTSQRASHGHHTSPPWLKKLYFWRKLQKAKFQSQTQFGQQFLRWSYRKHRDWKHHSLAWFMLGPGQDGSAAEHHWFRLQSISDMSEETCLHRGKRRLKDNSHSSHSLFTLLLSSGRRYRRLSCCNTRLQSSFFPQTVRTLHSSLHSTTPSYVAAAMSQIIILFWH